MDNQKLAESITKAIGYVENGGKPNHEHLKAGKTGELPSVFQFTPDTWKNYSHEIFGKEVPISPDAETHVVLSKVSKWLEKGYKPEEIFSIWNAGVGEPEAYGGTFSDGSPSVGTNKKYGVKFDVPGYVKKAKSYMDNGDENNPQLASNGGDNKDSINKLLGIINEAKGTQSKPQGGGLLAQAMSGANQQTVGPVNAL